MNELPQTLLARIGTVAVGMQHFFNEKGFIEENRSDRAIWNNSSFIIAFLVEFGICSVVDQVHIQLGFRRFYEDEDESFACDVWIREGVSFYRKQIRDMKNNTHPLPDVIVFNLLHPNVDKVPFEDLPLFEIDMFTITECWAYILDIIDSFFLSDSNIKELPRGC
ncbi:hypothetical protein L6472_06035 [Prevotella sp. E13-17]|uniref:hypothetical protein n=1 Tax=Prevotella sp. E13-17 TaxID=2913616 RepID=UPI001EDAC21E|nr:hypothetical protein [Prevotella sp. E13-17]UKK52137.1 hypothetical protein L6472_06035 [Prevotella sp. E13-17]